MSGFGTAGRTLGAMARTVGLQAAVENPDADSNSVAARGEAIEAKGIHTGRAEKDLEGTQVAQR